MRAIPLAAILAFSPTVARALPAAPPAAPGRDGVEIKAPEDAAKKARERVDAGVVTLERGGHVLATGVVLDGDGRVLSSLAPVGPHGAVTIRYRDGTTKHAKVKHFDEDWDLALIVPAGRAPTIGLAAARSDDPKIAIAAATPSGPGKYTPVRVNLRPAAPLYSARGNKLEGLLTLDQRAALGSPVLSRDGDVVAVVIRACAESQPKPCRVLAAAAPVNVLRKFLGAAPDDALIPKPWLGIAVASASEGDLHGVRVRGVAPKSPAAKAGISAGDDHTSAHMIVAVDGHRVRTPEELATEIGHHAIGDTVKLLVLADGVLRERPVRLMAAPKDPAASKKAPKPVPREDPGYGKKPGGGKP